MRILGADPGVSGALAVLQDRDLKDVWDIPTVLVPVGKRRVRRLAPELLVNTILSELPLDVAYVERVGSFPGQGVSSSFAFGQSYGTLLGILAALRIRTELITPPTWRKLTKTSGKTKDSSRQRACQQWPARAEAFARVKDDGRAEAALIALAGRTLERP